MFDREAEAEELCATFDGRATRELADRGAPARRRPLPDLARALDDGLARDLHLPDPRALRLGDRSRRAPTSAIRRWTSAAVAGSVDRVLLSSEPFHFSEQHIAEVEALVPGARVSLIDGEMTSWYGSRAIAGLRYLGAYARGLSRAQEERRTSSRAITSRWISFVPS